MALIRQTRDVIFNPEQPLHLRFLPIGTTDFAQPIIGPSPLPLFNLIITNLKKLNVPLNESIEAELFQRIRLDYLNNDIPIFSKVGGQIFYGDPPTGTLIN